MKTTSAIFTTFWILGYFNLSISQAAGTSQPMSGREAFAVMKGLAGEWHGTAQEQGKGPEVTVLYRVTSAGSAVIETLFPGTDHEMVTVYYLDEGKLVMTHYCAMGNQPRMVLKKNSTASDLIFEFAGGTNVNPRKDTHMHSARIQVKSADAITGQWIGFEDGKQADVTTFSLTRKN